MNWFHFLAAAILAGFCMSNVGAPVETVVAGVAVAGGVNYFRQYIWRR